MESMLASLQAAGHPLSAEQMAEIDGLDRGKPQYWDPQLVDQLDLYNIFLDKERIQRELTGGGS